MATDVELQDNISNTIALLEIISRNVITDWIALEDTLIANAEGAEVGGLLQFAAQLRTNLAAITSPGLIAGALRSQIVAFAKLAGAPQEVTDQESIDYIIQYMVDNSQTLLTRAITHGTPTPDGGNTGNGVILRLIYDEYGYEIESGYIETKTAKIVGDQMTPGASRHNEMIEFRGEPRDLSDLSLSFGEASGLVTRFNCWSETAGMLQNPSFSDHTHTAGVISDLPHWEAISSLSNFRIDDANYYRANNDVGTPASLRFNAVDGIQQAISTNTFIIPNRPYLLTFVYNRQIGSAAAGTTIRATVGSRVYTFPALAGTETGWNRLYLPLDDDLYYRNWRTDQPYIKIEVTVMASGYLLIDEIIFAQMVQIDSSYYAPISGNVVFEMNDFFSWTDTSANTAINQKWLGLGYGRSFPSAVGASNTWEDATI